MSIRYFGNLTRFDSKLLTNLKNEGVIDIKTIRFIRGTRFLYGFISNNSIIP